MNKSSIIMYTTEDGLTKIETTFDEDTVWLSLDQMAELFQREINHFQTHKKYISRGRISSIINCCKICNSSNRRNTYCRKKY
jgi:hypothetical protein